MSDFTDYLHDHLLSLMTESGIDKGLAIQISCRFVSDLRRDFNGEKLYVSSRGQLGDIARRIAIISEWKKGEKVNTLVQKYGLSRATIYRMIKG